MQTTTRTLYLWWLPRVAGAAVVGLGATLLAQAI